MKRIIYTIVLVVFTLCLFGCNNKNTYTLNDILGYDKKAITKIEYSVVSEEDNAMHNADIEETTKKLDVAYSRVDDNIDLDMLAPLATYIVYNGEEHIRFHWLPGKKVFVSTESGRYFSKEPISLLKLESITYTINEVLGFDKSEITKVQYAAFSVDSSTSVPAVIYNVIAGTITPKLDIDYTLNTSSNEIMHNDCITTFYLYRNEECVVVRWLKNKTVCIERPEGNYYSQEPAELISGVTVQNLTFSYTTFLKR